MATEVTVKAVVSLAAKLEALELSEDERAVFDNALAIAYEAATDEVSGFATAKSFGFESLLGRISGLEPHGIATGAVTRLETRGNDHVIVLGDFNDFP